METHNETTSWQEKQEGPVYTAEEMPPSDVEYGTGGTKPPRLKHLGKVGRVGQRSWERWIISLPNETRS